MLTGAAYVAVWLACSAGAAVWLFLASERVVSVAGHEAEIRPNLSGSVVLRTGPLLPDVRVDSRSRFGAEVLLGKTEAGSVQELLERYAFIATQPDAPADKVASSVRWMLISSTVNGLLVGAVPVGGWWLIGPRRRRQLVGSLRSRRGVAVVLVLTLAGAVAWVVRAPDEETVSADDWIPLAEYLGGITLPDEAQDVEVLSSVTTRQTRRLIESAVDTYRESLDFYDELAAEAAEVEGLRTPDDGETVAVLVSDRHDNVGMDAVTRALADSAGATAVLDAGDDTSTGSRWESFSLDSLNSAFDDYDGRYVAVGNHDHGDFVADHLDELGWTVLDGEVVDGPGGSRMLGVGDPRSSGLGSWIDETGLSFDEVGSRLADSACEADENGERVNTVMVHDRSLAEEALARGCVDLVLAGHTHVVDGPREVVGENGATGYRFTNGTTGGAAYAIATGTGLRRAATVSFVTYDEDGVPAGLQWVNIETNGRFEVGEYVELDL